MELSINNIAKFLLKKHEGLRFKPYKCSAGHWTIGYGHNIDSNPISGRTIESLIEKGITNKEASTLLDADIIVAIKDASSLCMNFSDLSPIRQAVLVDMAFNLGKRRMSKFVRFLEAIRVEDYKTAAKEMLDSLWARQVKGRAIELARMMEAGGHIA